MEIIKLIAMLCAVHSSDQRTHPIIAQLECHQYYVKCYPYEARSPTAFSAESSPIALAACIEKRK